MRGDWSPGRVRLTALLGSLWRRALIVLSQQTHGNLSDGTFNPEPCSRTVPFAISDGFRSLDRSVHPADQAGFYGYGAAPGRFPGAVPPTPQRALRAAQGRCDGRAGLFTRVCAAARLGRRESERRATFNQLALRVPSRQRIDGCGHAVGRARLRPVAISDGKIATRGRRLVSFRGYVLVRALGRIMLG